MDCADTQVGVEYDLATWLVNVISLNSYEKVLCALSSAVAAGKRRRLGHPSSAHAANITVCVPWPTTEDPALDYLPFRMLPRSKTFLFAMVVGVVALVAFGPPIVHLARTRYKDRAAIEKLPSGYADDMSRMNKTQVAENWDIPSNPHEAEQKLRELLQRAHASGLHISIAGARHSMGGQTIYPGGININMRPLNGMDLDEVRNLLHVQAGARWGEIIPYLDKRGRSIEVMQSDNSFTVGGSLSVNCHGWQYGRPPIASTVDSFHLMKADGSVVRCSRLENKELFSLALGGYGLFGVILDADLRVVPNERLRLEQSLVPLDRAMMTFEGKLRERVGVRMVYARLNVTRRDMFDDVLINMFYPNRGPIPQLAEANSHGLARAVFRGSAKQ